ncbi:PIG-L deacetylase family protein [Halalkalibacter okhensis]|uniref:GlcNAc-PI de-N-acetylase n=1 Tax=Halalkalibacter okhensis TaxID=333138 RepID=A0A0B0IHP5_9BACI|nr:PIG-L family deacetylase [Halalkalibacter okhensis]KHF39599.1 hypothetical protein LQ50_14260 [Halalkalibacter okhensis]
MKRTILKLARPIVLPLNEWFLSKYYKRQLPLTEIKAERILVLAPHVDDETIGLGGTILSLAEQGKDVHCIYITDGAKSVSTDSKEVLIQKRRKEARQVKDILGMTSISFFDEPDGQVTVHNEFVNQLIDYVNQFQPEIIFCPTFVDCHSDHVQTGMALASALREISYEGQVWCYEINCPIDPNSLNAVVDITKYQQKKEEAIDVFQSQAIDFDGFVYLSKVKTNLLKDPKEVQFVESFLVQSFDQFSKRAETLAQKNTSYSSLFKQVNKTETLLWGVYQNREKKKQLYDLLEGL